MGISCHMTNAPWFLVPQCKRDGISTLQWVADNVSGLRLWVLSFALNGCLFLDNGAYIWWGLNNLNPNLIALSSAHSSLGMMLQTAKASSNITQKKTTTILHFVLSRVLQTLESENWWAFRLRPATQQFSLVTIVSLTEPSQKHS